MSKADWIYLRTTNNILKNGVWDTNETVRPKWPDGQPAHTAKVFAVNNVYKMSDGFPITTLRFTNWKGAIDEVLWIWQKKSNNIKDLHSHIWDQWADENGSIGKAYGYQVGRKAKYKDGEFDQIDRVLWYLKNQPAFRSMVTELFVHEDLHEMGLYPCVHGMQLDVSDGKLNMFLNQRSNDTLAAGSWNVVQYAALLHMLAKVSGLEAGTLSHMIVNSHIYDRHIPFIIDMAASRAKLIEEKLNNMPLGCDDTEKVFKKGDAWWYDAWREFNKFRERIVNDPVHHSDYEKAIRGAKSMEMQTERYSTKQYQMEAEEFVHSPVFWRIEEITDAFIKHPEYEEVLGLCKPELKLDENVTDFYKFVSPLKTDENTGKFVWNEESSFNVENYDYEHEGIKFCEKVPVAE